MAYSAAGFSFQASVVNIGSIAHLLTGRALKAFSDGGVDFYAVLAVHVLGKSFVVKSSMEVDVRSHILALGRIGIQSVLAKALKIGWGHSGLAEDMSRTRAGTNALLLIGAVATGSTYFHAAECLSKLLSLHGCEALKLPNLDVLRHMIEYLSPFVRDLGFPKVLGYITAAAIGEIRAEGLGNGNAEQHLTGHEDAPGLAGAINQLILTSKQRETIYMITRMRGAWLCTFASHILGMAVELRLNDKIIWACGGDGTAIFELGQHQFERSQVQALSHKKMILIQPSGPTERTSVLISYPIGDAFKYSMVQYPMINAELQNAIRRAICRLSKGSVYSTGWFDLHGALRETLTSFGFEPTFIDSSGVHDFAHDEICGLGALDCMQDTLINACGKHQESGSWETIMEGSLEPGCLCADVGCLIRGFAVAATTLMRCHFNPTELMLSAHLLLGNTNRRVHSREVKRDKEELITELITNFMLLTCNDNNKSSSLALLKSNSILGLSKGNYTICYTCLLQNDCYDTQGRFLSVLSGRASVDGILRPVLLEKAIYGQKNVRVDDLTYRPDSTLLSPGFTIEPHYTPSDTHVYLDVALTEDTIDIQFSIGSDNFRAQKIAITESIRMMDRLLIKRCNHDPGVKFEVGKGYNLKVLGFSPLSLRRETPNDADTAYLFALHGNKLEQLITLFFLRHLCTNWEDCQFQLHACLKCCINEALGRTYPRIVIMGG